MAIFNSYVKLPEGISQKNRGPIYSGIFNVDDARLEISLLVGGLDHEFYDFPSGWECHRPN